MDLISRQAACEAVENEMLSWLEGDKWDYRNVVDAIMDVPSADTDLSDYSDKLWRAAYERGKKEAMESIVRCGECRHFDEDNGVCKVDGNGGWQADDFCSTGQRREE